MKQAFTIIVLGWLSGQLAVAAPPEPPLGQRWVLNPTFSDEFNGTALDSTKWYDHHPTWEGRPPGIFLPSQVSVKDGFMTIKGEKLAQEKVVTGRGGKQTIYTIAGGAVVSKSTEAWFGYYECRFKAAKTTMSTTFWLSSRKNFPGPKDCDDSYGLELDIQECIGRVGGFKGSNFAKGMNANSHFWYTDCARRKNDLRASEVRQATPTLPSEDFYTYGGWWQDASTVSFYLDDTLVKSVAFNDSIKARPFDQPMGVNLVSETYPFPWISLPTDEELQDDTRNTCYYDWVRAYRLVGVDEAVTPAVASAEVFKEATGFIQKPKTMPAALASGFEISYQCNADRELCFELRDQQNVLVAQTVMPALAGYGRKIFHPALAENLAGGQRFTAIVVIRPLGAADNRNAYQRDSFAFTMKNGLSP